MYRIYFVMVDAHYYRTRMLLAQNAINSVQEFSFSISILLLWLLLSVSLSLARFRKSHLRSFSLSIYLYRNDAIYVTNNYVTRTRVYILVMACDRECEKPKYSSCARYLYPCLHCKARTVPKITETHTNTKKNLPIKKTTFLTFRVYRCQCCHLI